MIYLQMKLQKQKKNVNKILPNVYKETISYNIYFIMNIYMDINNIIYLFIVLLMIYIFLFNLIKYNKIIEGVMSTIMK